MFNSNTSIYSSRLNIGASVTSRRAKRVSIPVEMVLVIIHATDIITGRDKI